MKGSFKAAGLLAAGFALGVTVAGSTVAFAALGKKGWDRFGPMFKQGYVSGFTDAVRIAKNVEPYSYMATQYKVPLKAKPIHWMATIDELYAKKEHEDRPMPQIISIAGVMLETKFGAEPKMDQAAALDALRTAIDKQRRALARQKQTVEAAKNELADQKGAAAGDADSKPDAGSAADPSESAKKPAEGDKAAEPEASPNSGSEGAGAH
jgi:hypothetical protein